MEQHNIYRTKNLFFHFIQIYMHDSSSLCFLGFLCGFLGFFASFRALICWKFAGCSGMQLSPSLFFVGKSSPCVLMHFCFLLLLASCFLPFQNSVTTLVYCLFLLSLLHSILFLCSARINSAGLSKLLDLRRTILLATSLFFFYTCKEWAKRTISITS